MKSIGEKIAIIGLIGGILVVAGVFGPWITDGDSLSGWDLTKATAEGGFDAKLPYVALVGGILAVIGAILALVRPGEIPAGLLAIGGILALIGVAIGPVVNDIGLGGFGVMGYGGILVVVGGILAILVTLGLKEEPYRAEGWLKS